MSNRPGLCWSCLKRENCSQFKKNPDAKVVECGLFIMKDGAKAIMQMLHNHFMEDEPECVNGSPAKKGYRRNTRG